jgi:uncharacterized membrane protein YdbT with pleckstrin-like domain
MAYPTRLLGDGETLVHEFRPHGQALLWPALTLIGTAFLTSYLLTELGATGPVPGAIAPAARVFVIGAALASLLFLTVIPVAKWLSIRYLITDRRLLTRWGLLTREGRDLPLARLTDVRYTAGPLQRMLGTGTMFVETMGDSGPLVMRCVPDVETVQRELFRLHEQRLQDPGGWAGPPLPAPPEQQASRRSSTPDALTESVDLTEPADGRRSRWRR